MAQRHTDALTELAELGMALARDVQARALAAPDEQIPVLTLAFHRISRSVRQTLALESRLERESRTAVREIAAATAKDLLSRVQRKRSQVRKAVAPLIWTEAEGDEDEAEALFDALGTYLMDAELIDEAFVAEPVEAVVARIRADLGLAVANGPGPDGGAVLAPSPAPPEDSAKVVPRESSG